MSDGGQKTDEIVDAAARRQALDVARSFVVQAPAGSGKTGLLVQRYLALLARVERPEAVLAMTFTRKAAGEMRRRIVEALRDASTRKDAPIAEFERTRHELASAVLVRDAALGWGLLHSPSRLQLFTIDGFCSRVVAGTPLLSRLGSTPAVVDDAQALYREAVRRALSPAGRELVSGELEILLERYEMGLERLEGQVIEMLGRREQWSEAAFESRHDEARWVRDVEDAFASAITAEVRSISADLDPVLASRIHEIARRSRDAVGGDCAWPTLGGADLLGSDAKAASAWRQASALLTKNGKLRTARTKDDDVYAADQALRGDFRELVTDLASLPDVVAARWVEGLEAAAKLPAASEFSPAGRDAVGAFLAVLRHAYLCLFDVFRERREVDHVEIAMRAVQSLAPGETLEKLDARVEHILVDEFQDTNVLQCNLLRGLTHGWQDDDGRTLFLVGDPMQSIYRFRKAEVGLFLAARSSPRFLETVRLVPLQLSVNFRSTTSLLDWVNSSFALLLGDRDDATRSLVRFAHAAPPADAAQGPNVELLLWDSDPPLGAAEADRVEAQGLAGWIAAECVRLRESGVPKKGSAPIAVLVRARNHALPLLRALERCAPGVRVRAPGLDKLSHRLVVTDLEALARALLHPGDRLSWLALLRSPWVGLTLGDLARLVEPDVAAAGGERRRPAPLPELLRDAAALARVSEDARRRIARLLAVVDAARAQLCVRTADIAVRTAWLRLGGLASSGEAARLDALDADAFFDLLAAHVRGGCVDLDDLSRALAETDASIDADAEADVEIMTMHKAKGLEFETVVLPALGRATGGETLLPLAMETEPDSGLLRLVAPRGARGREDADLDKYGFLQYRERRRREAELLRVLYVAATRARSRLLLSASCAGLKRDGGARAGSLLAALARTLDLGTAPRPVVEMRADAPRAPMVRFPADYSLAARPASVPDLSVAAQSPSTLAATDPVFFSRSKVAAHVGSVYHAFVQRIANQGLDAWPAGRIAAERIAIAHALRSAGVLAGEMDDAVARVSGALVATLEDERGRWILSSHEGARSEWGLMAFRERVLTSAVLDRMFVADGTRWIVDFKTSRWEPSDETGGAADSYVTGKCSSFAPQLAGYRDLFEAAGQPIRLGLFFPEWPAGRRWQDITDLAGRGAA